MTSEIVFSEKRFGLAPNESKKNRRQHDHHVVTGKGDMAVSLPSDSVILPNSDELARLRQFLTATYQPLDPILPREGPHVARWRLQVNISPDELEGVRAT